MLQVRVFAPAPICARVLERIESDTSVANIAVVRGAGTQGAADLILFDLAREGANPVIDDLRRLGVVAEGSIAISEPSTVLSAAAERAERAAPGRPPDGVVWDEIEDRAGDDARSSWSFLAFLILATLIAGVGRYLDQPILIIGAMVVGPEFAPLSALCVGLVRRRPRIIPTALVTLLGGFAIAIVVALLLWGGAGLLGLIDVRQATSGVQTDFIVRPDVWSFVIALLAGVAGILSLTSSKSSALVGVFISITTVPAAATIALTVAVGSWSEAGASAVQLAVNLVGLFIAGVLTLLVLGAVTRVRRRRP